MTRTFVAAPIVDQTDPAAQHEISVELVDLERPSGKRVFVQVAIDADDATRPQIIYLEPEQARRLAEVLEHGADLADREPIGIVRDLVEGLRSSGVPDARLARALSWLKRHDVP